jgi:two-component system, OmpR family, sensor histidine kinase MtrB
VWNVGKTIAMNARRALMALVRVVRGLPSRWRRSLQFRVVSVTMVFSLVLSLGLGYFIAHRVADGIVTTRLSVALATATEGTDQAKQLLSAKSVDSSTESYLLARSLVAQLCSGSAGGTQFQVMVIMQRDQEPESSPVTCYNLAAESVPQDLVDAVRSDARAGRHDTRHAFADVAYQPTNQPANQPETIKHTVVYGQSIEVNNYGTDFVAQIYYAFPLGQDEQTLSLVELSLVLAGLVLVLALVGIAWFVTRQVVMPVRMAASIAERLAAGRLEERMRVRGEDDLASLASSFNKMAANLQSQIRRLEELSRVQRRFVSDVSHELRTPLTTVRMAADLLHEERESFEPAVARSAELLQNQLDRFEELLADLLEISRFDAGAAILDAEPVDLRDLVRRVVDSSAPLSERKGSTVVVDVPPEPAVAEVDARRIDRIMRNLVVNAIEHGEGREVTITVAASEDAVAVAVRDHGVGLRPGESSLVFNRFWRADPARARTTGGTGLGLAIALEDARLHHGWLQAWGEPGGGSQFRLTVPRNPRIELLRSPIPLEPEDSSHHRERQRRGSVPAPPPRASVRPTAPDAGIGGVR